MSNRTVIQEDFYKGRQSIELHRTVRVDDISLRIVVDRDSYENQSFGRVEAWTDEGWKMVVFRQVEFLRAAKHSAYTNDMELASWDFSDDADDLEAMALATLGKVAA